MRKLDDREIEALNCCECGNPEIFALGECKECWEEKERLEAEESREMHQQAVDNFYAE